MALWPIQSSRLGSPGHISSMPPDGERPMPPERGLDPSPAMSLPSVETDSMKVPNDWKGKDARGRSGLLATMVGNRKIFRRRRNPLHFLRPQRSETSYLSMDESVTSDEFSEEEASLQEHAAKHRLIIRCKLGEGLRRQMTVALAETEKALGPIEKLGLRSARVRWDGPKRVELASLELAVEMDEVSRSFREVDRPFPEMVWL